MKKQQSPFSCRLQQPVDWLHALEFGHVKQWTLSFRHLLYASDKRLAGSQPRGVCMPVERFHPAWSLSGKCMDKDEVLSKTTRINGLNGWIAAFFSLFAVFIAGQVVDTVGRRPVLICFLSSNIVVKVAEQKWMLGELPYLSLFSWF